MLFKAPAYVSLLAANADGKLDATEKKVAIKFAHFKSRSCHPMLKQYRKEVDKVFRINIEELDKVLPMGKVKREYAIRRELIKLEPILAKLGREYSAALHSGLVTYINRVSKAHISKLEAIFFPMYIKVFTT